MMKKLLLLLIVFTACAFTYAGTPLITNTTLDGYGTFFTVQDEDSFTVVLEVVTDRTIWTITYAYEYDMADLDFPYDGWSSPMTVTIAKTWEKLLYVDVQMGLAYLRMDAPCGPPVIEFNYLGGGYEMVVSEGMSYQDQVDQDADQAAGDCDSGGTGSTDCSITGSFEGSGCSVSCGTGYYACCMNASFMTGVRCKCRANMSHK